MCSSSIVFLLIGKSYQRACLLELDITGLHNRRHLCLIYQLMLMNEDMEGSVRCVEVEVPALRLARLKKLLTDLQFNTDLSVNATLLAQHFGKTNQDYEIANHEYHQELCTRYGCKMGSLIKEGTRGRLAKGAEAGSNARRYL